MLGRACFPWVGGNSSNSYFGRRFVGGLGSSAFRNIPDKDEFSVLRVQDSLPGEVWEGTLAVLDLEALGLPPAGEENVLFLGKGATAGAFSYQGLDDVTSNRAILLNGETGGGALLGDDEGL